MIIHVLNPITVDDLYRILVSRVTPKLGSGTCIPGIYHLKVDFRYSKESCEVEKSILPKYSCESLGKRSQIIIIGM